MQNAMDKYGMDGKCNWENLRMSCLEEFLYPSNLTGSRTPASYFCSKVRVLIVTSAQEKLFRYKVSSLPSVVYFCNTQLIKTLGFNSRL